MTEIVEKIIDACWISLGLLMFYVLIIVGL